jgi:hypothetical protein
MLWHYSAWDGHALFLQRLAKGDMVTWVTTNKRASDDHHHPFYVTIGVVVHFLVSRA